MILTSPVRGAGTSATTLGALGVAGLAVVLELAPRLGLVSTVYLPPLTAMLGALAAEAASPVFWFSLYETLRGWAIGLLLAVGGGILLGVPIGLLPVVRKATASTIEFLRPIPSVALVPLAVLLFGTDLRSTLLLVVYAAFWQVLVQVIAGVRDVTRSRWTPPRCTGSGCVPGCAGWSGPVRCPTCSPGCDWAPVSRWCSRSPASWSSAVPDWAGRSRWPSPAAPSPRCTRWCW